MHKRIKEDELRFYILKLLSDGKVREPGWIIAEIGHILPFSEEDLKPVEGRNGEPRFARKVQNALASMDETQDRTANWAGCVKRVGLGLYQITGHGRENYQTRVSSVFGNYDRWRNLESEVPVKR